MRVNKIVLSFGIFLLLYSVQVVYADECWDILEEMGKFTQETPACTEFYDYSDLTPREEQDRDEFFRLFRLCNKSNQESNRQYRLLEKEYNACEQRNRNR